MFVAKQLNCCEITLSDSENFDDDEIDMTMVDILNRPNKYRFILIYRRPKCDAAANDAAGKLCDIMSRHLNCTGPTVILGDLNCPEIDWTYGIQPTTGAESSFYKFCYNHGFVQCVPEATRGLNTLDIVCVDDPVVISAITVQPPFSTSDHEAVNFELLWNMRSTASASTYTAKAEKIGSKTKRFLWQQCDYEAMSEHLSAVNWSEMFTTSLTPDAIWSSFCQYLDEAIDLFVPVVDVPAKQIRNYRRYPRHIRRLIARKLTVWRAHRNNRMDSTLKARYNQLAADCREAIKKHEVYLENKVIDNNNIGAFYNHANKKLSNRSNVGALKTSNGEMALTDADKAEVLNNFFSSICTQDDGLSPQFDSKLAEGEEGISTVAFDEASLLAAARRIKTKCQTSSGPDGYPVVMLKKTIGALARPLAQMFSSFMSVGKIPSGWKTANITPLYKKGPSSDPANYRPVSQTSVFCKLMERVIVAEVTYYMKTKGFISKHQHGFLNGRSTTTNLLESLSDWTCAIDNKLTQTIIYIDFTRAFDTVSQPKLSTKLRAYGVGGDLLDLINDFMTGREQRTRIGQNISSSRKLSSGVVQGSCLGPLMFLMFINDLPTIFDSTITPKMYADDLKMYASVESNSDIDHLQQNINRLVDWADTWQLSISIKKCQAMHITKKKHAVALNSTYYIKANPLPNNNSVSDLGVMIDKDLRFSEHISRLANKAIIRCKLLQKCFVSRNTETLVKAFKVYVLPILEYCTHIWSPHLKKDIYLLESVQRKFTRWLPGLQGKSYMERLIAVGLERLDVRRLRLDIILAYKIIFGLTCLRLEDFFKFNEVRSTRGHVFKLFIPPSSTDTKDIFSHLEFCMFGIICHQTLTTQV